MKVYDTKDIRNIGIVGHGHSGKTSLASAMLFDSGATQRLGRVDDGSAITDYDEDEVARKLSIYSSIAHCEWNGNKLNIIDTPGSATFILATKTALRAADAAIVVVDATSGVEVQTEKVWGYAQEFVIPRLIVVNKMDKERADFDETVNNIIEVWGRRAVPLQMPIGKEYDFKGVIDLVHLKAYQADGKATEIPAELVDAANLAR